MSQICVTDHDNSGAVGFVSSVYETFGNLYPTIIAPIVGEGMEAIGEAAT